MTENAMEVDESKDFSSSSDASDLYLIRGKDSYQTEASFQGTLLENFKLQDHYKKLRKAKLPNTFSQLVKDLEMPQDAEPPKGQLLELLEGVPFERPIQEFSEDTLKAAFTLKPVSKSRSFLVKTNKSHGHVPSCKETAQSLASADVTVSARTEEEERLRREKKEKKRKKREQQAEEMREIIKRTIQHLRELTWEGWVINGKPSNPFLQKITRQNCARLGVSNYFDYISTPMDLTTIYEKAHKGEYESYDILHKDVDLVVSNAKAFNREGEPVYQMAIELGLTYEAKINEYLKQAAAERKKLKKEKKKKKDKKADS